MVFRVFNNRDEENKCEREKSLKVKYQLLAPTLGQRASRTTSSPGIAGHSTARVLGICLLCGNPSHWVKTCPTPVLPPSHAQYVVNGDTGNGLPTLLPPTANLLTSYQHPRNTPPSITLMRRPGIPSIPNNPSIDTRVGH
jgi:hypothetical protein